LQLETRRRVQTNEARCRGFSHRVFRINTIKKQTPPTIGKEEEEEGFYLHLETRERVQGEMKVNFRVLAGRARSLAVPRGGGAEERGRSPPLSQRPSCFPCHLLGE